MSLRQRQCWKLALLLSTLVKAVIAHTAVRQGKDEDFGTQKFGHKASTKETVEGGRRKCGSSELSAEIRGPL